MAMNGQQTSSSLTRLTEIPGRVITIQMAGEVEFHRSGGSNTIDKHVLPVPVTKARYIRFHPLKQHNWNCLRVEVYGTDVDACVSIPCKNGGTCVNQPQGYSCICNSGYKGELCEIDIDECASNPCANGCTCKDEVSQYVCECPAGYEEDECDGTET